MSQCDSPPQTCVWIRPCDSGDAAPSGLPAWDVGWGYKDGYWIMAKVSEWNKVIEYFYLIAHYRQYKPVLHGFTGQLHTAFTGRYVCRHVFTIMSDTHMRWPMLLSTDGNRIPTFWYIDTKPIPTWYLVFQSQCVSYFVDIITPKYIKKASCPCVRALCALTM